MQTFKPVLVALGVVKFQPARVVASRGGLPVYKTAQARELVTAQEVTALGYDVPALLAQFERERMHGNFCMLLCDFCGTVWGVDRTRDYRDAYSDSDNPPWVNCCGRCYAKVLHAPWASSPYALYGRGPKWADMKNGQSPWAGRAFI